MHLLHWKKRPLVYATIVTIGIALLFNILQNAEVGIFITAAGVLYLILIFELYSTSYHGSNLLAQFKLPPVDGKHRYTQLIHHLILPSILYTSLVSFIYFNSNYRNQLIILLLSFILFALLFSNIRAFYEDKFKLVESTNNVYDLISVITIFLFTVSGLTFVNAQNLEEIYFILSSIFVFLILAILTLLRYKFLTKQIVSITLSATILFCLVTLIVSSLSLSIFALSFIVTIYYYYFSAYASHLSDGTATLKVFIEYFVVFLLLITIIFFGVS